VGETGIGAASASQTDNRALIEEKLRVEQQLKGGASWFVWIAALSVINSVILLSGGTWSFIFGLGITQIVDDP